MPCTRRSILIVAIAATALAGAALGAPADTAPTRYTGPRAPMLPHSEGNKADFEAHVDETHPWKPGLPFPQSNADTGLGSDLKLVWTGFYADGGTRGYLFRNAVGNYFAVCDGPGLQSEKPFPGRIDAPRGSRLFIRGLHYTRPASVMVPPGSKSEAWLRKLLASAIE